MYYFSALLVTLGFCGLRDYGTGEWTGGDDACSHTSTRRDHGDEKQASSAGTSRDKVGGDCRRCGARRVDSQLGLEATPDQYVERMVAVFREVWRVLRDDGTVWLNLGDSYNAQPKGNTKPRSEQGNGSGRYNLDSGQSQQHWQEQGHRSRGLIDGLKPKDLCMIPARVALALQAPWYSGTIKNEADRRWLAATIDAEGCIYISRSKEGAQTGRDYKYQRTQDSFDVGIRITNTSRRMLEEVQRIVGHGNIRDATSPGRAVYEWNAYSSKARVLLRELYPHFIVKAHEARLAHGCPPSGEQATAAHEGLKAIHQGGSARIDFPEPESMFERGWCLRSDLIWAKLCPTPCPNR